MTTLEKARARACWTARILPQQGKMRIPVNRTFGGYIDFRINAAINDRESTGDGQYSWAQLRIAAFGSKNGAHYDHGTLGGECGYRCDWNVHEIVHEDAIK